MDTRRCARRTGPYHQDAVSGIQMPGIEKFVRQQKGANHLVANAGGLESTADVETAGGYFMCG
jgi:hypothetical protein